VDQKKVEAQERPASSSASLILPGSLATQFGRIGRDGGKDLIAGLVVSVILIGNIISFGALMFPGGLSSGIPTVIWAMLIGGCIGGVWNAVATSLPPLATSIDSPTGAVLVLLSASTGADVLAAGGTPETAVLIIMITFTAATVLSGALLYGLGKAKLGAYFRFVPYFVVGGFMAATGWFLVLGGVRMASGHALMLSEGAAAWRLIDVSRVAAAVAVVVVLLGIRKWVKWAFAMPLSLIAMWVIGSLVLKSMGLSDTAQGFYFPSLGMLTPWSPFEAARDSRMSWSMVAAHLPELIEVSIVALISLVTKISSIEVGRQTSGTLDCEFRAHGMASLLAAPFGGITSSLGVGSSRLLEYAGGTTRMSGVFCSLMLGAIAISNIDLIGLIPVPIIAGLVLYLGYTFIVESLWRPFFQRAWVELALAIAIMAVCIQYGFLIGVVVGVIFACVLFAISYARRGVIRRHLTRANFTSNVERSAVLADYLQANGVAIQIYWLSGYVFFGSSESVFERIRRDIRECGPGCVKYVILDFGHVSGTDASAVVSFTKLRNFCNQQGITIIYCSLSVAIRAVVEGGGLIGGKGKHHLFTDLSHSVAWCENELLTQAGLDANSDDMGFEPWLQHELGSATNVAQILTYFDRKIVEKSQVLYRQGELANTIDLIAAGNLAIDIVKADGSSLRVRRIMTYNVIGEMGFFRQSVRAATVSSDGPVMLFTLTRESLDRMKLERPDLAVVFCEFILRVLADRVEFADHTIAALSA